MSERILHVCGQEGVELGPGAMATLGRVSGGDLRKAITTLQSAVCLAGSTPPPLPPPLAKEFGG